MGAERIEREKRREEKRVRKQLEKEKQ